MIQYFPSPYESFQTRSDLLDAFEELTRNSISRLHSNPTDHQDLLDNQKALLQSLALSSFFNRLTPELKNSRTNQCLSDLEQHHKTNWVHVLPLLKEWIEYDWEEKGENLLELHAFLKANILFNDSYDEVYAFNQFYEGVIERIHMSLQLLLAFDAVLNVCRDPQDQATQTLFNEYQITIGECKCWLKEASMYLASLVDDDHDALYLWLCVEEQTEWLLQILRSSSLEESPALSSVWSLYQKIREYKLQEE